MRSSRLTRGLVLAGVLVLTGAGLTTTAGAAGATGATGDRMTAGQTITAASTNTELVSPSGQYVLEIANDGLFYSQDVYLTDRTRVGGGVWSVPDLGAVTLTMQADGNLVLYSGHGVALWSSHTQGTGSHDVLEVQNDGSLVVYSSNTGKAVWAVHAFETVLAGGQTLQPGQVLRNIDEIDRFNPYPTDFTMQADGNLVDYYGSHPIWSTRTKVPGSRAILQLDGNLVVYSPAGKALWSSGTQGQGSAVWLQPQPCGYTTITNDRNLMFVWQTPAVPKSINPSCG